MNNTDFIVELANKLNWQSDEVSSVMNLLISEMQLYWQELHVVSVAGFGVFKIIKEEEFIVVNQLTHQRMLIPPKLVLKLDFNPTLSECDYESAIVNSIVGKTNKSCKDIEEFIELSFSLIKQITLKDKYLRINGLGTFKLLEQNESDNITFMPESTLEEFVNKPFSYFESVVLNDDVQLMDTIVKGNLKNESQLKAEVKDEVIAEEFQVKDNISSVICHNEIVWKGNKEFLPNYVKYGILGIIIVTLGCIGTIYCLYQGEFCFLNRQALKENRQKSSDVELKIMDSLNLKKHIIANKDTSNVLDIESNHINDTIIIDSKQYICIGVDTLHLMKVGENLTKLSLMYYGTKSLWPCIVKYNSDLVKNPDKVPLGTVIKIPKLKAKR